MNLSLHQLDFAWPPALIDPGLQRAVQTQADPPALAGNGLQPVAFLPPGRLGAEVDVVGAVGVLLQGIVNAADAREPLVGLQHGAGLVVVERERPEVPGGDVRRQVDPVGPAAIEGLLILIRVGHGVLRALADHL